MTANNHHNLFRGRVALYAILRNLNITKGDYVAIQAFTCIAVPEAILQLGAKPVYIDIEEDGYNMCPVDLKQKLIPRCKAVVVQHTFGIPAKIKDIKSICHRSNLYLIEDCCHSFHSTVNTQLVGTFGTASFHSYEWGKPLALGIGGSYNFNKESNFDSFKYKKPPFHIILKIEIQYLIFKYFYSPKLYWVLKNLFNLFSKVGLVTGNFNNIKPSTNSPEFSWLMSPQVEKRLVHYKKSLKEISKHSVYLLNQYMKLLENTNVTLPILNSGNNNVLCRLPLRVKDKKNLLNSAKKYNVELANWYKTPVHPITDDNYNLIHYIQYSCPNAEQRCKEVISLPLHSSVTYKDVLKISNFLRSYS